MKPSSSSSFPSSSISSSSCSASSSCTAACRERQGQGQLQRLPRQAPARDGRWADGRQRQLHRLLPAHAGRAGGVQCSINAAPAGSSVSSECSSNSTWGSVRDGRPAPGGDLGLLDNGGAVHPTPPAHGSSLQVGGQRRRQRQRHAADAPAGHGHVLP